MLFLYSQTPTEIIAAGGNIWRKMKGVGGMLQLYCIKTDTIFIDIFDTTLKIPV